MTLDTFKNIIHAKSDIVGVVGEFDMWEILEIYSLNDYFGRRYLKHIFREIDSGKEFDSVKNCEEISYLLRK